MLIFFDSLPYAVKWEEPVLFQFSLVALFTSRSCLPTKSNGKEHPVVKYISLLCILFSLNSFASTNGGGVLSSVIVYHMGENEDVVKFANAQLINNKLDVKNLTATEFEFNSVIAAKTALDQSQNLHQWIRKCPHNSLRVNKIYSIGRLAVRQAFFS